MAVRTISSLGGNWDVMATWAELAVPTAADDVVATATSGNLTINVAAACRSFDLTNYVGTLTHNSAITLSIGDATAGAGNVALKLVSGMTYTRGATTSQISLVSTSATQQTIDTGGKTMGGFTINGVGSSYALSANFTNDTAASLTVTAGTFDANGFNVTVDRFSSANSNTRTITMGTGIWTLFGTNASIWNINPITGLTFNRSNSAIICNYSGSTNVRTIVHANTGEGSVPSFSITAGTDTVTLNATRVNNLDFTGFSGILGSGVFTVYGNLTFSSGMTATATTNLITMTATSGSKTIDTKGVTIDRPFTVGEGTTATTTWTLLSNLVLGSTRALGIAVGTFNANNFNVTTGLFSSSNANTRTITMGSGTWTLSGTGTVWNMATTTNLTLNQNTSTITLSDTSITAKTFAGGGKSFNILNYTTAATGSLIFTGANTFATLNISGAARIVTFPSSTITTISSTFNINGTAGNLITINSNTAGTQATLSKSSGIVSADYLSLQDSKATGGAAWYAGSNSTNVSNNTGWAFYAPPSGFGNLMQTIV